MKSFIRTIMLYVMAFFATLVIGFTVCGVLLPVVSLHFYLIFPRPKQFLLRHPRWTLHFGEWTSFLYLVTPSVPESTSCRLHLHWSKMGPEVCFT